jgi:hypothetical protein
MAKVTNTYEENQSGGRKARLGKSIKKHAIIRGANVKSNINTLSQYKQN